MFSPSINGDADSFRPLTGPVWSLPVQAVSQDPGDTYINDFDPVSRFAFMLGRGLTGNLLGSKASLAVGYLVLGAVFFEVVRHVRWKR